MRVHYGFCEIHLLSPAFSIRATRAVCAFESTELYGGSVWPSFPCSMTGLYFKRWTLVLDHLFLKRHFCSSIFSTKVASRTIQVFVLKKKRVAKYDASGGYVCSCQSSSYCSDSKQFVGIFMKQDISVTSQSSKHAGCWNFRLLWIVTLKTKNVICLLVPFELNHSSRQVNPIFWLFY